MSRINITIDRLVLRGIDPADRYALENGLRTELAHILADSAARAALTQSRRAPVIRLGGVRLDPGQAGARKLGKSIARVIGKGLSHPGINSAPVNHGAFHRGGSNGGGVNR